MASKPRVKLSILPRIAKWSIYAIAGTCRISVGGEDALEEFKKKGIPLIYIYWHRHIFFFIYQFRNSGIHPLISLSSDGAFVAKVAEACGMNPVRGSSSRGGARAFRELVACLVDRREEVLITADGPKGPARVIKEGVVRLADMTGFPVVPVSWYGSRQKIFNKSWDRFLLPLPFSRIRLLFGQPICRPAGGWPLEKTLAHWQEILNDLERRAQTEVGMKTGGDPEEQP